jgi:hypothetical protein
MMKTLLLCAAAIAFVAVAPPAAKTTPISCSVKGTPRDVAMLPGKRFTVHVEGKGPDIILIPGLSTSREVWQGISILKPIFASSAVVFSN